MSKNTKTSKNLKSRKAMPKKAATPKTTTTTFKRTTVAPNIELSSPGRYRCKLRLNGTLYTTMTTSLNKAKTWVKTTRANGCPVNA